MADFIHVDTEFAPSLPKETYSKKEKRFILEQLNHQRREKQNIDKSITEKMKTFMNTDVKEVYEQLNSKLLSEEQREVKRINIEKNRTENKKIYTFIGKKFYKFKEMERIYYIEVSECHSISSRPSICTLYYKTFEELIKKDVLIKTEVYSSKFFISHNVIRVYCKPYVLEDIN